MTAGALTSTRNTTVAQDTQAQAMATANVTVNALHVLGQMDTSNLTVHNQFASSNASATAVTAGQMVSAPSGALSVSPSAVSMGVENVVLVDSTNASVRLTISPAVSSTQNLTVAATQGNATLSGAAPMSTQQVVFEQTANFDSLGLTGSLQSVNITTAGNVSVAGATTTTALSTANLHVGGEMGSSSYQVTGSANRLGLNAAGDTVLRTTSVAACGCGVMTPWELSSACFGTSQSNNCSQTDFN